MVLRSNSTLKLYVNAINERLKGKDNLQEILNESIAETTAANEHNNPFVIESKIKALESKLKLLIEQSAKVNHDKRNDYYKQISEINVKIEGLKANRVACEKIDNKLMKLEDMPSSISEFDDNIVRQLIDYIRVIDKDSIEIRFKTMC